MTISRYKTIDVTTLTTPAGDKIRYLRRRFLPAIDGSLPTRSHVVAPGEVGRPDIVALVELGDPELSWQLADINPVLRPSELCSAQGNSIRVPTTGGLVIGRSDGQ